MIRNLICFSTLLLALASCSHQLSTGITNEVQSNTAVSKYDSIVINSFVDYCYHIEYRTNGNLPIQGTAFYLKYKLKLYFVSALHNFTGKDPASGKFLKSLSASPKEVLLRQDYFDRAGWTQKYDLYSGKDALILEAGKDNGGNPYDIAASNVSDSLPFPLYILNYDKIPLPEVILPGDTIFYCAFNVIGSTQTNSSRMFIGKILKTPDQNNSYIISDIFGRPGSSGAAVFKISEHKVFLIGVITRGNPENNIVYITPLKRVSTS